MVSPDNLKQRTVRALAWSTAERIGRQGFQFVITVVLARLLTPEDFGLIGILTVFIVTAEAFVNNGFGAAIIQRTEVSEDDLTTAFLASVGTAVGLFFLTFGLARLLADFYRRPELVPLTRLVAVVIVLDSLIIIQRAIFERSLDFRTLSQITIAATMISGVGAVGLAVAGFGVWSLAAHIVAQKALLALFLWYRSIWVPRGRFRLRSFTNLLQFGWKLQVSALLNRLFRNVYVLVIGRAFSVDIVGYYAQAKRMKDLPMTNLAEIVNRVTFPAFATIQDQRDRLKRGYRRTMTMLAMVAFPLMTGMLITAPRLIPVLLGGQWEPAIPLFQLLCLVGVLYVLQATNMNILKVTGRSDLFLKLSIVKKVITLTAVAVSIRWGLYGLVIGQVVTAYIAYALNATVAGRLIDYSMKKQIEDVAPYLALTAVMALFVWLIGHTGALPDGAVLILQTVAGIGVYVGLNVLFSTSAWTAMLGLLPARIGR